MSLGVAVTARVLGLPIHRRRSHVVDAELGLPAEFTLGLGGVGVAGGDVAGATRLDRERNRVAGSLLVRLDDLKYRVSVTGTQVVGEHAGALDLVDDGDVALGQIDNVDVVAHAGSVGRVIVVTEHLNLLELAECNLGDVGGQVCRNALRILADQAGLVGADRVEVAQDDDGPGVVGDVHVAQDLLLEELGRAVRVRGAADLALLSQRQLLGRAIDGGGRREDDLLDVVGAHGLEQHDGAVEVVVVVFDRLGDRLADGLERGEMNHPVDVVLGEDAVHQRLIADIALVALDGLAGDLLDAIERLGRRVAVVVHADNVVPLVQQLDIGVRTDVARAARYQNGSHVFLLGKNSCG